MSRRSIVKLSLIVLLLLVSPIAPQVFTAQASNGCSALHDGLMTGMYFEGQTRLTGVLSFSAGDRITVNTSETGTLRLVISGSSSFSQEGAPPLSFTVPKDGDLIVSVTNTSFWDLNQVNVGCTTGSSGGSAPWSGFTDERLNPDLAENYSLWCKSNFLNVYRSPNGVGQLIASIALVDIINLEIGRSQSFGSTAGPITLIRDTGDAYRVTGNSGTNAPAYAEKAFTLTECALRNGGLPTVSDAYVPNVSAPPVSRPGAGPVSLDGTLASVLLQLGPANPSLDRDGDDVPNSRDLCPDFYAPRPLQWGCPDNDGDGLSNPADYCPEVVGPRSFQGCPDTDGDGVSDIYDMCPNYVPPADKPSIYGCLDSDGDGVPNGTYPSGQWMDWCPLQGKVTGISMYYMGCPDPDGDWHIGGNRPGVPAVYRDDCPDNSAIWDAGGQECPAPTPVSTTPPTVSQSPSLFQFAAQQGAFAHLWIEGQNDESVCIGSMGFCSFDSLD